MPTQFDTGSVDFEKQSADDLLDIAENLWGGSLAVACGFTLEDLVLLHKLKERKIAARVFFIDTGRHFEFTYAAADMAIRYFGMRLEWYFPDPARMRQLMAKDGPSKLIRDPEARRRCCDVRRIEPLTRALEGAEAWMVGARREHATARQSLKKVTMDRDHNFIPRLAPIVDWTWGQVVQYVNEHKIPANALYRKSYASIGCMPCTRPITPGEPQRAGRWAFEAEAGRELGPHISGEY